jgi:hypothetical protein
MFEKPNENVHVLRLNSCKDNVQCYEVKQVMCQSNKMFIEVLNKFWIASQTSKDIKHINSQSCWWPPTNLTTPYLFYTNIHMQKHNEYVFTQTPSPTTLNS